jgi:hypothetical protein
VCLLSTGFSSSCRGNTDDAIVGVFSLRRVCGHREELLLELTGAGLDEVKVSIQVDFDVTTEDIGGNFEEITVLAELV